MTQNPHYRFVAGPRLSASAQISVNSIPLRVDMVRPLGGMMIRWMSGLLVAAACLLASPAHAQDLWAPPEAQMSGFHEAMLPHAPDPAQWHRKPGGGSLSEETLYHLLPANRGEIYEHDSPLGLAVQETLARSSFRVDYLLWNMDRPGNILLGAPITGVVSPTGTGASARDPFIIQDRRTTRINILGQVPSLDAVQQDDLNGIRGTLAIPFVNGTAEMDVWSLQNFDFDIFREPTTFTPDGSAATTRPLIAVTSLTADGQVVPDSVILYSEGYAAEMQTSLMGTEFNWLSNAVTPNQKSTIQPLLGFRYIRLYDRLKISGQDIPDPINAPGTILNHLIDSRARNDVFGPHFGLKSETNLGAGFTLGIEPKVLFGLNRIKNSVETQQIFSTTEDPVNETNTRNRFAPALDLSIYAKWQATSQLSFRVGYDLLWAGGISRSFRNIRYDAASSPTETHNIGLNTDLEMLYVHGLVLGGEWVFR